MIKVHSIALSPMKKDKRIKELDDWLKNSTDEDFSSENSHVTKVYEFDMFDYDFDEIMLIDNNPGKFEYRRNGVQEYVLNKLKKKKIVDIVHIIDLHGETVKDAIAKLDSFFLDSYTNHVEYISIICGKGTNSIDKVPKIKIMTQAYIKKSKIVNAACTASDKDGGVGVIKVKLKN
jgi:DNA-nicking Smr family endonuclease